MTHWPLCRLDNCKRIHYARGLCKFHYQKAKEMGIDPRTLNDRQVELVDPSQRKAVVKARGFDTSTKRKGQLNDKAEKALHNDYISFLRRNELAYVHANPVKPSTIQRGCPDFIVTGGEKYGYRCLYGEFKRPGETLSEVQRQYIAYLGDCGCRVYIWYDYETAAADTATFFELALPLNRCQAKV